MFTWNFQYVSKARLVEDFNQLMLYSQKGDILITGTPEGVSEIKPGDVVVAKIQNVGTLTNKVR